MILTIDNIESVEAIIFDFDGVLTESTDLKTDAFKTLFQPYGPDIVDKVISHHIAHGGISRYIKLRFYFKEYLNKELSEQGLNNIANKFSRLVVEKVVHAPWVTGAEEFLQRYSSKIDCYIASGTPERELMDIVRKRNMIEFFKGIYGVPKTKPEIIQDIININNYSKSNVYYIGDSYSDYQDAQTAGAPFIGRIFSNEESPFPPSVQTIHDFSKLI